NHGIWDRVYDPESNYVKPNIYQWMLGQADNSNQNDGNSGKNPNQKPIAKAGGNQEITLPKNSVVVDGSGSEDKDGKISGYKWSKVSGPASFKIHDPNNKKTEISELREGTYKFRLTVTDDDKATATDDITVVVNKKANQKPIAKAGGNKEITLPENSVVVDGSGSEDNGSVLNFHWKKMQGPGAYKIHNPHNKRTQISNLREGKYKFRLTVTNNDGAIDFDEIFITVKKNSPPTVIIKGESEIMLPKNRIFL